MEGGHFESGYVLSFCWLPPAEAQSKAGAYLVERGDDERGISDIRGFEWRDYFIAETDRGLDLLANILPEIRFLDDAETLTHLHSLRFDKGPSGFGSGYSRLSRCAS